MRSMNMYIGRAIQFQSDEAKIVNTLKTVDDTKKLTSFFNSAPSKTLKGIKKSSQQKLCYVV